MQCSFSIVIWISIEYIKAHGNIRRIDDKTNYIIEAAAFIERFVADGSDGVGDGHAGQAAAVTERTEADACDRVGDGHAGQAAAAPERIVADGRDGVGDGHTGQTAAIIERIVADCCDGVGDGHAGQADAVTVFATYSVPSCFNQNGRKMIMWILWSIKIWQI